MTPAEALVLIGALGLIGALFLSAKNRGTAKGMAAVAAILFLSGAAFGGLAFAGIPAFIEVPGEPPLPTQDALFTTRIMDTSDTDRVEAGEIISSNGNEIRWSLSAANMAGMGDITLVVEITNTNLGDADQSWPITVDLTFIQKTTAGSTLQPIVNLTAGSSFLFDWSITEGITGTPTWAFATTGGTGDDVGLGYSNNFPTGGSESLTIALRMNPEAMNDWTSTMDLALEFLIGGNTVRVFLIQQ
jgi:hypothetical protein